MTITTTNGIAPKFDYLQQMDAIIKIEQAIAGNEGTLAMGIRINIKEQTPADEILKQIREMASHNINAIYDLLGVKLTNKIINL